MRRTAAVARIWPAACAPRPPIDSNRNSKKRSPEGHATGDLSFCRLLRALFPELARAARVGADERTRRQVRKTAPLARFAGQPKRIRQKKRHASPPARLDAVTVLHGLAPTRAEPCANCSPGTPGSDHTFSRVAQRCC